MPVMLYVKLTVITFYVNKETVGFGFFLFFSFSFLFLSVHSNILKALNVPENENSTESMVSKEMGSMKAGGACL